MDLQFNETDKQIAENVHMIANKFIDTDQQIKALSELFNSPWSQLVELLAEGDLKKVLEYRGIDIAHTMRHMKSHRNSECFEFDIIGVSRHEIVIVEVKTTLLVDDVNEFHEKLWKAKRYMPEYHDKKIYGGVAFIIAEGASDRMSEKLGLFVIRATGNSSSIINRKGFEPKAF